MENFWLFQQARCEVIDKYTNCNLLEHEWNRTGIRILEVQIDEKNKNIEARQNVGGSYKRKTVYLFWVWMNSEKSCKWQATIKLSLAYSFRKIFFIGQNLKHVHMTYPFLVVNI